MGGINFVGILRKIVIVIESLQNIIKVAHKNTRKPEWGKGYGAVKVNRYVKHCSNRINSTFVTDWMCAMSKGFCFRGNFGHCVPLGFI